MTRPHATIVGSGPNGLAAGIVLAEAGWSVQVVEGVETIGGGCRTEALTLPGFVHDVCSAVHPLAVGSPFLSTLPLADHGLRFLQPEIPLAHPFDDGTAAVLGRSIEETVDSLDRQDGVAYRRTMGPLVDGWDRLVPEILAPLHVPRSVGAGLLLARFGLRGLRSAGGLARARFRGERARGLFAGLAGHSMLPLEKPGSAAIGLVLGAAGHSVGWPIPEGGARSIAEALAGHLRSLGGTIETGRWVRGLDELDALGELDGPVEPAGSHEPEGTIGSIRSMGQGPPDGLGTDRAVLLDLGPRQLLALAGERLPPSYRRRLARFRYGPGVCKVDWALSGPIPWRAAACRRAGTVHLGGTLGEIAAAEAGVWRGEHADRPYVLLSQPTLVDPGRAPEGKHVAWGYCHVPSGSAEDRTEAIEAQVERFAPGFRDLILARHTMTARDMEAHNPNSVGGDINGGAATLGQIFFRPAPRWSPYTTPLPGLFLCSSSTPPGGGVHGMCGFHAARAARSAFK